MTEKQKDLARGVAKLKAYPADPMNAGLCGFHCGVDDAFSGDGFIPKCASAAWLRGWRRGVAWAVRHCGKRNPRVRKETPDE